MKSDAAPSNSLPDTGLELCETDDTADARSLSKRALNTLYQRYFRRLVIGLKSSYGLGPPDPEEIAQRAFAKLSEKENLHTIKDLEGYTWITARNFMMTEKRSMRVRAQYSEDVQRSAEAVPCDDLDPERVLISKGDLDTVIEALNAMPERRRRIFLACRVEGLTPEAAGRRCGVSRSSAVRHVAVATAAISEALGRISPADGTEKRA